MNFCHSGFDIVIVRSSDSKDALKSDKSDQSIWTETDLQKSDWNCKFQTTSKCGLDLICKKSHFMWFYAVQTFKNQCEYNLNVPKKIDMGWQSKSFPDFGDRLTQHKC